MFKNDLATKPVAPARPPPAERPWRFEFTDFIELALSGKKARATSFQFIGASPLRPH